MTILQIFVLRDYTVARLMLPAFGTRPLQKLLVYVGKDSWVTELCVYPSVSQSSISATLMPPASRMTSQNKPHAVVSLGLLELGSHVRYQFQTHWYQRMLAQGNLRRPPPPLQFTHQWQCLYPPHRLFNPAQYQSPALQGPPCQQGPAGVKSSVRQLQ